MLEERLKDGIYEQKRALRARFSALRAALHSDVREAALAERVLASDYLAADRFFIYYAVGTEAGTLPLIRALLRLGKTVCLPRIEDGVMKAVPYGRLQPGAYGIPAPVGGEDTSCDVAFAPLLAVDDRGVRLGYGGGYYDAYFARCPQTLRVGLCYAAQLTDRLPCGPSDVPLQAVVTEEGVRIFRNT